MTSPLSSDSGSPQARTFRGSRPPSPSVCPGMLNLEAVNEQLKRQRTESPEPRSAEKERLNARRVFDELVEMGGVPLRPWSEYRAEDLTEAQLGYDNGEDHLMCLYMNDWQYWQTHLRVWGRFAKRRKLDSEPDLRDLEPIDAVSAFIGYARGHLQRDMEDRAEPGCEVWPSYTQMGMQRELVEDILELLPAAETFLQQLQKEKGGEEPERALRDVEVTREALKKEYRVPDRFLWMHLWWHTEETLPADESEPESEPEPALSSKRRRRDDGGCEEEEGEEQEKEEKEEEARPSKRRALGPSRTEQEDHELGSTLPAQ